MLTAAHVINGPDYDNLEQKYFTLNSDLAQVPDPSMKLIPFTLGDKLKISPSHPEEVFKDPITKFRCLNDNDVEILLLIGKSKVKDLKAARLSFLQNL